MKFNELMLKNGMFKPVDTTEPHTIKPIFQDVLASNAGADFHNACCGQTSCTCNGSCRIDDVHEDINEATANSHYSI
ncbi:MAG: hypothetical protein Tsb005_21490 [Gammaproteobacteria bacterium]